MTAAVVVRAAPKGFWWANLSWLKREVRRGTIRGAASVTVITEKMRREKRSRRGARRICDWEVD